MSKFSCVCCFVLLLRRIKNKNKTHRVCVPQGAHVEWQGGAETGEHGQPEVTRGHGSGRHRRGQRAQAEPGRGLGWGRQLADGARLERRSMAVLVRVQGAYAPPEVAGEGVGRLDVALPAGLDADAGAQQLLCVLKVARVGNFPLAQGALPKGGVGVDGHHGKSGCIRVSRSVGWSRFLGAKMLRSPPSDLLHLGGV